MIDRLHQWSIQRFQLLQDNVLIAVGVYINLPWSAVLAFRKRIIFIKTTHNDQKMVQMARITIYEGIRGKNANQTLPTSSSTLRVLLATQDALSDQLTEWKRGRPQERQFLS